MLKLKGQTGSGEWVVFSVSDIEDADRDYTEIRLLNGDNINYLLTSTIQPADDPRKQMLDEIGERSRCVGDPRRNGGQAVSELKPCPFCGCVDIEIERVGTVRASCIVVCTECGCKLESNETGSGRFWNTRAESPELATLREQVKVLREALEWLDNEMDCRDDEFGGCLFSRQDFGIVRDALAQTKPKDGE